jgi:hypothetical protein
VDLLRRTKSHHQTSNSSASGRRGTNQLLSSHVGTLEGRTKTNHVWIAQGMENIQTLSHGCSYVVVMMKQSDGSLDHESKKVTHYCVEKSCGISAGIFCAALHNANLVTLCSTPMYAEEEIRKLLGRTENERVFPLMPVGYPSEECTVPYRDERTLRKPLDKTMKVC